MTDNVVQLNLFQNTPEGEIVTEQEVTLTISHQHLVHALEQYLKTTGLWPYGANVYMIDADFGLELNDEGVVEVDLTLVEEYSN